MEVPAVLLSGNHEQIRLWREKTALEKTREVRPDLMKKTLLPQGSIPGKTKEQP
jgi:tRNA (guanine37-N1)-methyltransferase